MLLAKEAAFLGSTDSAEALKRINDSMCFELKFESETTSSDESYYLNGEAKLTFNEADFTLSGDGTGYYDNYVSYSTFETRRSPDLQIQD